MATGTVSDFKVYNEYVNGNFFELFMQNTEAFNEASRGAITLTDQALRGDYDYESFYEEGPAAERRVPTDTSTLTFNNLTQDEIVRVKLHRGYNQALTRNQWLRIGKDPAEFGRIYARQLERAIRKEMLNTALSACNAALSNVSALMHDASDGALASSDLVDGLTKFGDGAENIVCWVMHSVPFYALVKDQITVATTNVTDLMLMTASPLSFGRPIIVTDSASLVIAATGTRYMTLGLTAGAISCVMSEGVYTAFEEKTGLGNIVHAQQTEYAYNLGVKGFKYDTGNGGANPIDASIATAAYWDQAATDNKSLAGVRIRSQ